jgi:hypothetical protein
LQKECCKFATKITFQISAFAAQAKKTLFVYAAICLLKKMAHCLVECSFCYELSRQWHFLQKYASAGAIMRQTFYDYNNVSPIVNRMKVAFYGIRGRCNKLHTTV